MPNTNSTNPRPILLIHGAWHGAWCWSALQTELDRRGVPSYAVDLPGHGHSLAPFGGLHHDANHVRATLDQLACTTAEPDHASTASTDNTDNTKVTSTTSETQESHSATSKGVILVGHSYGGAVISQAALSAEGGTRSDIAHLVYVAAFALHQGESVMDALLSDSAKAASDSSEGAHSPPESLLQEAVLLNPDGSSVFDPSHAAEVLYGDCAPLEVQAAIRRLCFQPGATMTEAPQGNPRDSIPSTYVSCLRDRAIGPGHQSVMAQRCSQSFELDSDHSPFLSQPKALAEILEDIAKRS